MTFLGKIVRGRPRSGEAGDRERSRVAFVLPTMTGGGVERIRLVLMQGFLDRGYEVDLVVAQEDGALIELVPPGVKIVRLRQRRFRDVIGPLRRYMRDRRPDVCIVSLWPLTALAVLARVGLRGAPRLILSDHNILTLQYRGAAARVLRLSLRATYRWADALIGVSRDVARDVARLASIKDDRVKVIHNPVPAHVRSDAPPRDPADLWGAGSGKRILTVGTLKSVKNHALLIDAFAQYRRQGDGTLAILGDGALRGELEQQVRALGLIGHVLLPGFDPEPHDWYASADLFVLSSKHEGFGNVLVEALHFGLPIVATRCRGGPEEILDGGRFGTLVPVGDAAAMAVAMRAALAAPRLIERQRARATDFSVEHTLNVYEVLVRRVLA
ncbi:glycosyltransferase [Sphingomonas sp.]|uniref:glycosyltransferase n=1 Tax=Sphingomonas sp. TaxID=28214 RepID=UPI0035C7C078